MLEEEGEGSGENVGVVYEEVGLSYGEVKEGWKGVGGEVVSG